MTESSAGTNRNCASCAHFRKASPGDPLLGWNVISPKIYELRAKWEKHLTERALFEQQRFESGLPFDFEPAAYPYCDYFSRSQGTREDGSPSTYVLCAEQNPGDDCPKHDRIEA